MKTNLFLVLFAFVNAGLSAQIVLPDNMYADSAHAPFLHGVASGDPLTDKVIIWTRITPDSTESKQVIWEIATDESFTQALQTGSLTTDSTIDWTVKIDVPNLMQGTTYYYRFRDEQGNYSVTGRTKTAPSGNSSELKFAVVSCSSAYSGYFNAYRRIGERDDVNLVIHLGDYVYNFADANEEVRIPIPYPANPANLDEWREREAYWLLDPDFRFVKQQHPFTIMWDNHDLALSDVNIPTKAFLEWTPTRVLNQTDVKKIYRKLSYGGLADIFILDVMLYRDIELISADEYSILGTEQYNWFLNELGASTAKWKIVGFQKMFSYWGAQGLDAIIPTEGGVFNVATWDGYMLERKNVLDFIDANNIDNVIMISGDSHVSLAADLTRDPTGSDGEYNPETGEGALGVELLPTSVTRGNFDEQGLPDFLLNVLYTINAQNNPHQVYVELTKHGYGLWNLGQDSAIGQIWYSDILVSTTEEDLGKELVVYNGANHYKRAGQQLPSSIKDILPAGHFISEPYPNPAADEIKIDFSFSSNQNLNIEVYHVQLLRKLKLTQKTTTGINQKETIRFSTSDLAPGTYIIYISGKEIQAAKVFVKQ